MTETATGKVRPTILVVDDTPANLSLMSDILEDDYIVTANGLEWITKSPREIAEIEAMMKKTRM